jgi:hypothetical protein
MVRSLDSVTPQAYASPAALRAMAYTWAAELPPTMLP